MLIKDFQEEEICINLNDISAAYKRIIEYKYADTTHYKVDYITKKYPGVIIQFKNNKISKFLFKTEEYRNKVFKRINEYIESKEI